jgi:AraC family transcriptional regulator
MERLMLSFLPELESGGLGGELYAESLANALAVHLLRQHSSLGEKAKRKIASEPKPSGLPARQLRRALDYIGDNLASDLSLEEMAGAANLSPYHFARLFKESTGLPPHQYVIRERVERAKGLLAGTDRPVGEVARLCGFATQSHLARHFGRLVGATPARFRRETTR